MREDEKYRSEYKAEPQYAQAMNEAEYIAMRRVDDNLDALPFPTAAATTEAPTEANWLASEIIAGMEP